VGHRATWQEAGATLLAVGAGGALGGGARYALLLLAPHGATGFPWATLTANVTGSFAMGVLAVLVSRAARPHRLVRPFLGVGVLGGFTTFSTYAVDTLGLTGSGAPGTALAYMAATLVGALAAVWAGAALTRALTGPARGERA
jgi:CrcB protein